jgi:hypothetical protein
MHKSRAKACYNCREAKVRCSLRIPCQRCSNKVLFCDYAPVQRPKALQSRPRFRQLRPVTSRQARPPVTQSSEVATQPVEAETRDSASLDITGDFLNSEHDVSQTGLHSLGNDAAIRGPGQILTNEGYNRILPAFRACHAADSLDPADMLSGSTNPGPQLTQRGRSLQQGSLTAKMLSGRLAEYTRMMAIHRDLPPFIYPPCVANGQNTCAPGSPHTCLPYILSRCARLTGDFQASKLGSSRHAIWQATCDHLQLMQSEVCVLWGESIYW